MNRMILFTIIAGLSASCKNNRESYDASGAFEAVETIVSSQAAGTIKALSVEEGQELKAGQSVGYIDSLQLYLKKQQLEAQIGAILSRKPDINAQTAALQEQLRQAEREQKRVTNLLEADAATRKQLDDATSLLAVIRKQIAAQESSLNITKNSLDEEVKPLRIQISQLEDQLAKCRIINGTEGIVLSKYAEVNEVTAVGKPLYKTGALNTILLRAYITGDQILQVKPGQQVKVLVDNGRDTYKTYPGIIEWISDKSEFTPKTIQTKDERANLVYAIKVKVKNDGFLKIGMYGEVKL